ncbi:MAG: mannonate dehydratase [Alphaproteobacteria bacterium]
MAKFKLGLGLYAHMLDEDHYRFAKQCGASHVVLHLVDYLADSELEADNQPIGGSRGWGVAGKSTPMWTLPALMKLKSDIEKVGLKIAAIENFDPAHWHDILLDGPKKEEQFEYLKQIIRNVGQAGIPIIGYNFSLAGVASRTSGPFARGGAMGVGMEAVDETPVPNGTVWNMVWDRDAPQGSLPSITHETLWQRVQTFLEVLLPVAEEAGVRLAAHPDDPPAPFIRQQPRLVYQPHMYQKLLDLHPSDASVLEFCIGSVAEMTEGDVYETIEKHAKANKIGYIHFRNVTGKVPQYKETFVDDGALDMARIVDILEDAGFEGVLIPDHTPLMSCEAPWHAGMAYAMGYMRALQVTRHG